MFGKVASDKANASEQVGALIAEIIESENLRSIIVEVGLDFQVGLSGSKLSQAQMQKFCLARALVRYFDTKRSNVGFGLGKPNQSYV